MPPLATNFLALWVWEVGLIEQLFTPWDHHSHNSIIVFFFLFLSLSFRMFHEFMLLCLHSCSQSDAKYAFYLYDYFQWHEKLESICSIIKICAYLNWCPIRNINILCSSPPFFWYYNHPWVLIFCYITLLSKLMLIINSYIESREKCFG